MKKSKKALIIAFAVILLLLVAGRILLGKMVRNVQNIPVFTPDLSEIADGNYIGEYSIAPVSVKVEVVIDKHQITQITILQHQNGLGSAAESIVNDVTEKQSLEINAVSGATVSSKCILKAIENAIGS